jgi:hypothetical protein
MGGPDDTGDLDARERERVRRRDRDLSAAERALMRTGQAKVFKQVLDRQVRRAGEPVGKARRGRQDPDAGAHGDPGASLHGDPDASPQAASDTGSGARSRRRDRDR